MFYALAEPYFSLERADKIGFITNRLDITINKSTLFYAVRSKQTAIATFQCCISIISEIKSKKLFSDFHL